MRGWAAPLPTPADVLTALNEASPRPASKLFLATSSSVADADKDAAAAELSVSSTPELVALLRAEVQRRRAEDEERAELLLAQLAAWREERQLETAVLLDALRALQDVATGGS